MFYYLNELSICNPCCESKSESRVIMESFTTVCRKIKKLGYDQLRYDISLKGICLSINYYVESWLKDDEVEKEIKDRYRDIVTNTPFIDEGDEETQYQKENIVHNFAGKEAFGLGLAQLKSTMSVSFMTDKEWDCTSIELEKWILNEGDGIITTCEVMHVSKPEHLDIIKKNFEFNPKHGICGKGAFTDQSIMYCCNEYEAEILLNTALPHPRRLKWYCNYDKQNGRFIVFLPHEQEHNKYHGFHYENQRNADPDRDLNNDQNGIPLNTQKELIKRMNSDL